MVAYAGNGLWLFICSNIMELVDFLVNSVHGGDIVLAKDVCEISTEIARGGLTLIKRNFVHFSGKGNCRTYCAIQWHHTTVENDTLQLASDVVRAAWFRFMSCSAQSDQCKSQVHYSQLPLKLFSGVKIWSVPWRGMSGLSEIDIPLFSVAFRTHRHVIIVLLIPCSMKMDLKYKSAFQTTNPNDCVRAEPVIYKKLEASSDDVALLRAFVGDRPTWRNAHHPLRTDSKFKLTGVPTLVRWENEAITGRLEDHEAHVEHKIDTLISGN
ncbi:hypothetical protein IFM89_021957 [Coptis chinensis]|uniref:Thioredoxin domain-containing protein n=1 Tax=Coptis chinensis TaxID=261450 RepID=A0A835HGH6_9MAGN|nr:hypothetical protein IFM89_021957 [Coptis chinensis]